MTRPEDAAAPQPAGRTRPLRGIVMIVCDQLHAGHLGFAGNPDVHTPNIDRLAGAARIFDRAHVANPTCMPNRSTIATGRWPSAHGTRTNGLTLDWRANTFMSELRRNGWRTAAVGKLHLQSMGWPWEPYEVADIEATDALQFDPQARDARVDPGLPDGWDRHEELSPWLHGEHPVWDTGPDDYYGFEHVDIVIGHADGPGGHYRTWVAEHGLDLDATAGRHHASRRFDEWDEIWQTAVPAELHPTAYVRDRTINHLRAGATGDRPFLVFTSFPDPHHPFSPPEPYYARHDPDAVAIPATFDAAHTGLPAHLRQMLDERGQPRVFSACWAPNERQLRATLAAQYGSIEFIDDAVGAIVAELDRLGLADEVAVVFTTDHGDMMGEHGLLLKHAVHYPALTRVPLFVHAPGVAAGVDHRLASSADIAPTVLDLARVGHFRGIQGRSLLCADTPPRRAVVVEEEHLFGIAGLPAPITIRTLITDDGRLTVYHGQGTGELYDHAADPDELHNCFGDPAAAAFQARMTEQLAYELVELADRGTRPWASA